MFLIPIQNDSQAVASPDSIAKFGNDLSALFGAFDGVLGEGGFTPALDVHETHDAYVISADLPGMDRKDIKVRMEDGVLSLSGSRAAEHRSPAEGREWRRVERAWGAFERRLNLGEGVDAAKVTAEYRDGVLKVRVPKKESAQPRLIEVS